MGFLFLTPFILRAFLRELFNIRQTIWNHGVAYFFRRLAWVTYLAHKNDQNEERFPVPPIYTAEFTPVTAGLLYTDKEWESERPKAHSHLMDNEDAHIFEGSHVESGRWFILQISRLGENLSQVFLIVQMSKDQLLTLQNEVKLDLSDRYSYQGCGLKLECLAAMRRWRIAFNGLMKDEQGHEIHVKFGAIWAAADHVFEYPQHASVHAAADSLSHLKFFARLPQVEKLYENSFAYAQPGHIDAQFTVANADPVEVHLWGSRTHLFGPRGARHDVYKFAYFDGGHRLHLISRKVKDQKVTMGYILDPTSALLPVTAIDELSSSRIFTRTDRLSYEILTPKPEEKTVSISTPNFNISDKFIISKQEAMLGESRGIILTMTSDIFDRQQLVLPVNYMHQSVNPYKKVSALVLDITEEDCKRSDLTGGKGSSLAVLTSISKQFKNFTVPSAVVLTTTAYGLFAEQRVVRSAIEELTIIVLSCPQAEILKKACEDCVNTVEHARLPAAVLDELKEKMAQFQGNDRLRVAIRSSAVGEDCEEMSAAGQMKTYLSVPANDMSLIAATVVKCWASQFSFTAVSYKRQYGQTIAVNMAVVIQEMVPADAAGVMFTCNPVTSNPNTININANYGLGESVVSGMADPDTFMLRRDAEGNMTITQMTLGKKRIQIRQSTTTEAGPKNSLYTEEIPVGERDARKACISNNICIRIATIGHQVESCFSSARDIEWAVVGDRVFLLQNRHVTSIMKETDFEVENDTNGRLLCEREILGKAMWSEIFPGAMSVLGSSIVDCFLGVLCREFFLQWRPAEDLATSLYITITNAAIRKQKFLPVSHRNPGNPLERSIMYASYGRDISQDEVFKKGVVWVPAQQGKMAKIRALFRHLKFLWTSRKIFHESTRLSKTLEVFDNEAIPALQQLQHIVNAIARSKQVAMACFRGFIETALYNAFIINILANANNGDISVAILTAVADLIQAGEVESVDVPLSLQRLGAALSKSPDRDRFIKMKPEEALAWLQTSNTEDAKSFQSFLDKHGHRCVKEFDVFIEPWAIKPTKLIKSLQVAAAVPHEPKPSMGSKYDLDNIAGLKLTRVQKMILGILIPLARNGVVHREIAKSACIRTIHKLRVAINHLADAMVREGRLPERELVFFLSFDEIRLLIATRSPTIVMRAIRRFRVHATLDGERFPLLQVGFPCKLQPAKPSDTLLKLMGTPVCQGEIEGPARVIIHFESEAHLIQKGDILITTATDTGWTPYFPILGGVVTEIGGLASHGAVVAREYGLPCVVGVDNVTRLLQSGDRVRLNGSKGLIEKVGACPDALPKESTEDEIKKTTGAKLIEKVAKVPQSVVKG